MLPLNRLTCPSCGATQFGSSKSALAGDDGVRKLYAAAGGVAEAQQLTRIVTGIADRNWGEADAPGIVTTSVTMFAGEPGAGKSTLFLQILLSMFRQTGQPGLYVGAEESGEQIGDRAKRLGLPPESLLTLTVRELSEGKFLSRDHIKKYRPCACVIDSIQKYVQGAAAREELCGWAKQVAILERVPFFLISQVNKDDDFQGSMGTQHEPDTLLFMNMVGSIQDERKRDHYPPSITDAQGGTQVEPFRILTTRKNRFGGGYESYWLMTRDGLKPYVLGKAPPPPPPEEEDEEAA